MPSSFECTLRQYDYALPEGLIARSPASPRDAARLLIHDRTTGETQWSTFAKLADFLPQNAVLVFNRTKVIPARLPVTRSTGGRVLLLFLNTARGRVHVLANRRLSDGEFLTLSGAVGFGVLRRDGKEWILKPTFPLSRMASVFKKYGQTPLPPYIKNSPLNEAQRRREYQTVFAKTPGSIAAPTASLHFTKKLLQTLKKRDITISFVTLHVHLGTFAPLTEEQWKTGTLHRETYEIDAKTAQLLQSAKKAGKPIIAVGTTVLRTLESAADAQGALKKRRGTTSLFIKEGYRFRVVDGLITNFHVPKSSLLMLVAAFTGREEILSLYQQAIQRRCRFFSFGDGMLIL